MYRCREVIVQYMTYNSMSTFVNISLHSISSIAGKCTVFTKKFLGSITSQTPIFDFPARIDYNGSYITVSSNTYSLCPDGVCNRSADTWWKGIYVHEGVNGVYQELEKWPKSNQSGSGIPPSIFSRTGKHLCLRESSPGKPSNQGIPGRIFHICISA